MSFVAVPARSAGRYAQLIHIYLWTTCGIPHDFPQNVDKRENLWITFSVQRPYDNRKSRGFQGLFGADFFGKNACYPQTDCFSGQGYPQYPVVCGKARHKFSRELAGFPSFSRQKVWNCAQRFSGKNFVGRGMHREKGELWRNGPSARSEEGSLGDRSLPRPVGETGRRSVGNRKERCLHRDYASFPDSCPSGGILWARPLTFPYREAMKGKSSQGAKRTLTVGDRTARFFRSSMQTGKPPFPEGRGFGMRMRKEGLCASRLQAAGLRPELSPASPLRPAFFGLRMGTLGDFIPQTPSLGPEPAAASGGNRQAERRKSQGVPLAARLCEFPGSPDPFFASRGFKRLYL